MPLHVTANTEVAEVHVPRQDIVVSPALDKPIGAHLEVAPAAEVILEIEALLIAHQVTEVPEVTVLQEVRHQEAVAIVAQVVEVQVVVEVIEARHVEAVLEVQAALVDQVLAGHQADVLREVALAVEEIDSFKFQPFRLNQNN